MSYRTFKRVLGATSLERKFLLLFGASLLILIAGSFWWYGRSTEKLVYDSSTESAKSLVVSILAMHHASMFSDEQQKALVEDLTDGLKGRDYDWQCLRLITEGPGAPGESDMAVIRTFNLAARPGSANDLEAGYAYVRVGGEHPEYLYYKPIRFTNQRCTTCHTSLNSGVADMAPQES